MVLNGIIPILITPFDSSGAVDEASLRRVVEFEVQGGAHALGVGGFASEAYKLTDAERLRCAEVVTDAVAGRIPVIIGIAPGSLEAGLRLTRELADLQPAAFMTLPPCTMSYAPHELVSFYVRLADGAPAPLMVQQSPHLPAYQHTLLSAEHLAQIARDSDRICAFKIEGAASAARIAALRPLIPPHITLFGGVGGIALQDELRAGASGLLPGVGFNDVFYAAWHAWQSGDASAAHAALTQAQPLVDAVSGHGHEFSLHARKHLLHRAGLIATPAVRAPAAPLDATRLDAVLQAAAALPLRINALLQAGPSR
jgi:4-hydroxy-tetrahydrodipicolinate synthase